MSAGLPWVNRADRRAHLKHRKIVDGCVLCRAELKALDDLLLQLNGRAR